MQNGCDIEEAGRPRGRSSWTQGIAVFVLIAFLHLVAVPAAVARNEDAEGTGSQYGLGVSSVLLTIPYGLIKVVMATMGGLVGGLTYTFSGFDDRAAQAVWYTSMRGTYVITPGHLRGEEAVRFFGLPPRQTQTGGDVRFESQPEDPSQP